MVTSNEIDFSQQLGRTIAGVSDIWCLAAIATTNNDDAVVLLYNRVLTELEQLQNYNALKTRFEV